MGCALSSVCGREERPDPDTFNTPYEDRRPQPLGTQHAPAHGQLHLSMPKWFSSGSWSEGDLPVADSTGRVHYWLQKAERGIPDPKAKTAVRDADGQLIAVLFKDRLSRGGCYIYSPKDRTKRAARDSPATRDSPAARRAHAAEVERAVERLSIVLPGSNGRPDRGTSPEIASAPGSPEVQRRTSSRSEDGGAASGASPSTIRDSPQTLASVVRERARIRRTTAGERELEYEGTILEIWAQARDASPHEWRAAPCLLRSRGRLPALYIPRPPLPHLTQHCG